jgi:hypothetical protein
LYGRSGRIDATVTTMPPSAVHRVLGGAFDGLPAAVRVVHDHPGRLTASGRADAALGPGVLPRLITALVGMPRDGSDQPVTVTFETDTTGVDHWRRDFAGRRYRSRLFAGSGRWRGLLVERQGILTTGFALEAAPDALHYRVVRFGVLGLALPQWLTPRCHAVETGAGDRFSFDITIDLPGIGRLIRYCGTLVP